MELDVLLMGHDGRSFQFFEELSVGKPHAVPANVVDVRCDLPKKFERQIGERVAVADWWHAWIPD